MLGMFMHYVQLSFKGKLFRDNKQVLRQWLKGFALTLAIALVAGFLVSPLAGVILGSVIGGALQPYLFKNLKYS